MFRKPKDLDRVVRSRALDRAHWLIRDHGDEAEAVIAAKLARPGLGAADRILYRLTQRELRALRRLQPAAAPSRALVPASARQSLLQVAIDLLTGRRAKANVDASGMTQTG